MVLFIHTSVGRCQKMSPNYCQPKNIIIMTIIADACTIEHTIGDMNLQHFFCFMVHAANTLWQVSQPCVSSYYSQFM